MKKLITVILFCSLFLTTAMTTANVYKWTDKDGNVHYGDQPVSQHKTKKLNINTESEAGSGSGSGITGAANRKKARDQMLEEFKEDREERKQKRDDKRAEKKKLNKQCARAKDRLRRYREASGVYKLNKNGERVFQSNKTRANNEKAIQKAINKHCR